MGRGHHITSDRAPYISFQLIKATSRNFSCQYLQKHGFYIALLPSPAPSGSQMSPFLSLPFSSVAPRSFYTHSYLPACPDDHRPWGHGRLLRSLGIRNMRMLILNNFGPQTRPLESLSLWRATLYSVSSEVPLQGRGDMPCLAQLGWDHQIYSW